jgi:hypothetical protein
VRLALVIAAALIAIGAMTCNVAQRGAVDADLKAESEEEVDAVPRR